MAQGIREYLHAARGDDSLLHVALHTFATGGWELPDVPACSASGAGVDVARRQLLFPMNMTATELARSKIRSLYYYYLLTTRGPVSLL